MEVSAFKRPFKTLLVEFGIENCKIGAKSMSALQSVRFMACPSSISLHIWINKASLYMHAMHAIICSLGW